MKKNIILIMLAFVFAIGFSTDVSAAKRELNKVTKGAPVTEAKVFHFNNQNGKATCFVYPDSRGDYSSIYDITNSGAAMADSCGGCPAGQTCKYSKKNDSWSCGEPDIKPLGGECPLPPCPGE